MILYAGDRNQPGRSLRCLVRQNARPTGAGSDSRPHSSAFSGQPRRCEEITLGAVMSKTRTKPWDAAEHLKSDEEMAAYLEAALDDGDLALVAAALGHIARANAMTRNALDPRLG